VNEDTSNETPSPETVDAFYEMKRQEVCRKYKEKLTERFYDVANPTLKHKEVEVLNSPTRGTASVGVKYYNKKNV